MFNDYAITNIEGIKGDIFTIRLPWDVIKNNLILSGINFYIFEDIWFFI